MVRCFYLPGTLAATPIETGMEHSPAEVMALDVMRQALLERAYWLVLKLDPGDLLMVDNSGFLHSREEYVDSGATPRRAYRVWLDAD